MAGYCDEHPLYILWQSELAQCQRRMAARRLQQSAGAARRQADAHSRVRAGSAGQGNHIVQQRIIGAQLLRGLLCLQQLLSREQGTALLQQLAALYLEDEPNMRAQLAAAEASGDLQALHAATHAIKGAVANFSADAALHASNNVEALCRDGNRDALPEAFAHLNDALDRFASTLRTLTDDQRSTAAE